jgi:hypothetical protein
MTSLLETAIVVTHTPIYTSNLFLMCTCSLLLIAIVDRSTIRSRNTSSLILERSKFLERRHVLPVRQDLVFERLCTWTLCTSASRSSNLYFPICIMLILYHVSNRKQLTIIIKCTLDSYKLNIEVKVSIFWDVAPRSQ